MLYLAIIGGFGIFWIGYLLGSVNGFKRATDRVEDAFGAVEGGRQR